MDYYKNIKADLSARCSSVKHFNRAFFNQYVIDYKNARAALEAGNDPQQSWKNSATLKSKFYCLNSCAYCEFLAVASDYIPRILAA